MKNTETSKKDLTTCEGCDTLKETSISQPETDLFGNAETTSDSYDMFETESSILEEEDMLAKYHNENTIYLYCVVDGAVANAINNCEVPIKLYEDPLIARKAVANANIQNRVTLRFPILVQREGMYYYDEFIVDDKMIKSNTNKSKDEFIKGCSYTRTLNKQLHCIEYLIRDKRIIAPPQII